MLTETQNPTPAALAQAVLDRLDRRPEAYDQRWWICPPAVEGGGFEQYSWSVPAGRLWPQLLTPLADWPCGTTACAAGHLLAAAVEAGWKSDGDQLVDVGGEAAELLGYEEPDWGDSMFDWRRSEQEIREWLELIAAGHTPNGAHAIVENTVTRLLKEETRER